MKVFISNTGSIAEVGAIVMNHKVRLGNKYAFLFNKDVIAQAKTNLFSKPPKRSIRIDLDSKLEEEASTSTGSGETVDQVVRDDQVKIIIAARSEDQSVITKKLMEDLLNFEEFLGSTELSKGDTIREIRKFTRFLIANCLKKRESFSSVSRESISLAAILLAAEKFELEMDHILSYISKNFQNRRINKLSKIKETKAFSLLSTFVESFNTMPSSP